MRATDDVFIDHTLKVWQPRSPRPLSHEDARQIAEHVTGFFRVLLEWHAADREVGSQTAEATSNPSPATRRRRR